MTLVDRANKIIKEMGYGEHLMAVESRGGGISISASTGVVTVITDANSLCLHTCTRLKNGDLSSISALRRIVFTDYIVDNDPDWELREEYIRKAITKCRLDKRYGIK